MIWPSAVDPAMRTITQRITTTILLKKIRKEQEKGQVTMWKKMRKPLTYSLLIANPF